MENINGIIFKKMLENGANNLTNQYTMIDALNVFPVPDGDTGTNMSMTFNAGVKEILQTSQVGVGDIAKVLSKGLLMGARGNSGVILSQIFRGLYQGLEGMQEVNGFQLANAFVQGSRVAYKAVMRPVEGTILTVIRESADYTLDYATKTPNVTCLQVLTKLVEEADASLTRTPDLLPVLKEVGVVDSGGAGLVCVLKGFLATLNGDNIERLEQGEAMDNAGANLESEEFGYCTEFIIRLSAQAMRTFNEDALKDSLARIGNSLVVVQDEDIVKVHVHTLTPGEALNLGQRYGEFVKLKIENMSEQHDNVLMNSEVEKAEQPRKKYAIIAVAAGQGLNDLFLEMRADVVISGGQTMNPSTEGFVAAIAKVHAETVYILPNNSNIILAAQQAASVCEDEHVIVLPSKSIPQGYGACINFNPEVEEEENTNEMTKGINNVRTGQVTFAIKDTTFEGLEIKAGDYMGINEKDIVVSTVDKLEATHTLLDQMIDDESELVTLFIGEDASEEEVANVVSYIEEKFPQVEVEPVAGDQPVYVFVIGVE